MKLFVITILINLIITCISSDYHEALDIRNKRYLNTDDKGNEDYDGHGCCLSCGEFFCHSLNKCIDDWDSCDLGYYDNNECKYYYNNTIQGFAFDLSSYQVDINDYYEVSDEVSHPKQHFKYYFNLCEKVNSNLLPDSCQKTVGTATETCSDDAFAYQYFSADWDYETCYRLSSCVKTEKNIELGLLDPVEPASGIYIKYFGGNTCANSYADKEACDAVITKNGYNTTYCGRSFRLNINCNDEIKEIPEKEEVEENAGCAYEATINHRMGCPIQCPRNSITKRVCSGRGLCFYSGYDSGETVDNLIDTVGLECICEKGFYGDACESAGMLTMAAYSTGAPVWLLVTFVLLFILTIFILIATSFDKILLLFQGDFEGALPFLFGYRAAPDGRGFYSNVQDNDYISTTGGKTSLSYVVGNTKRDENFTL